MSRKTIQRWAEDGTLPYLERIGDRNAYVFARSTVEALAAERRAALAAQLDAMSGGAA